MAEWDSICVTDSNGKMSLEGNWTNIFADKFHDINNMCVLKFKNYWFKKSIVGRLTVLSFEPEQSVNLIIVELHILY